MTDHAEFARHWSPARGAAEFDPEPEPEPAIDTEPTTEPTTAD